MRPYSIIVFNIFSDQILKMLLSEHKEIIKVFSFNGSKYKLPAEIKSVQKPRTGFGQGGFVVISGEKK